MDNELNLGNEVRGRIFRTTVFGNSASEMEIAALSAAQAFFGEGVPLEVIHDYQVSETTTLDRERVGDKQYVTSVSVRAVVQP